MPQTNFKPVLYLVKAFTQSEEGGNAAGVVLQADTLVKEQKQAIAANLGLSETAFVSASEVGNVKVEFFTPIKQIPHCGHATVATFGLLWQKELLQGHEAVKESIEGVRTIVLRDGKIFQSQLAPTFTDLCDTEITSETVAASLGVTAADFVSEPVVADTGVSFLLIRLPDEEALRNLEPDQQSIALISENLNIVGYYAFTTATTGADASARMFAPSYGIPEESATGMAAGPLACYLHDYVLNTKSEFVIHQGYLMQPPSPSQLEVQLELGDNSQITGLKAGGPAFIVKQLELEQE